MVCTIPPPRRVGAPDTADSVSRRCIHWLLVHISPVMTESYPLPRRSNHYLRPCRFGAAALVFSVVTACSSHTADAPPPTIAPAQAADSPPATSAPPGQVRPLAARAQSA